MKKYISALLVLTLTSTIHAAETDQFYAAKAVIRDSSNEMNDYFHEKIELALRKVNQKNTDTACREVAREVLTQVLGEFSVVDYAKSFSFSKVSQFTQKSPLVDRYPEDSVKGNDYRKQSIYKNRPFPTNIVGIASTININGIYLGTDKIGHFSIIGKAYYSHFLEALEKGESAEEAQNYAIHKGFKQEEAILGYKIGGTFSFGDLEANYQGYVFGRNMCEGANPHLAKVNGQWIHNPAHLFDIREYINPKMDEAYNVSLWSPRVWRKMKDQIIPAYCKNKTEPAFLARVESYNRITKQTLNDTLIDQFVKEKPTFDRNKQLLSKDIKCNN